MATTGGPGHAFISYVRENAAEVDRIERILKAAGIAVWRDTADLWPGEDWQQKIQKAITDEALVFIACFSDESVVKAKSYQREELILAIEEYRLRNPAVAWLIPVRLSDCELPSYSLGAGRTLDSVHRVDLFGENWEEGSVRLAAAVLRALGRTDAPSGGLLNTEIPEARVKRALLDPSQQIELDDYVSRTANAAAVTLVDPELFPSSSPSLNDVVGGPRFIAHQVDRYWTIVEPLTRILGAGGAWGKPEHDSIWTRAIERIANTAKDGGGHAILISLRRFPTLPLLYGAAISAVHRSNFGPLRAVAVDAVFRRNGQAAPIVANAHIYLPFENGGVAADVLALEASGEIVTDETIEALRTRRKGGRHTPVSDLLHDRLRPFFADLIPDDEDFDMTFDRVEVLLGALAADQVAQLESRNIYSYGPWFGRFTWRDRRSSTPIERGVLAELEEQGDSWPPLGAGLFGGKKGRAEAALVSFCDDAARVRGQRW